MSQAPPTNICFQMSFKNLCKDVYLRNVPNKGYFDNKS